MPRLYSNPNAWRRTLNLSRVTDQQLRLVDNTPHANFIEASQTLAELDEAVEDNHAARLLRRMLRIKPIMDARPDKRCRPKEVSKQDFKDFRKFKFKVPGKKKRVKRRVVV